MATLCPPMVYGPIAHSVGDVKALNTSSGDINRLIDGSEKDVPDTSFWAFADVRDRKISQLPAKQASLALLTIKNTVAEAHVLAYEKPEAAGQRYLIANSAYSYQQICDIIRDKFPELSDLTPKGNTGAPLPPAYQLDTSKAVKELGIKFRPLQETVMDMVNSLLKLRK